MGNLTREKLIEVAAGLHDEAGCSCDRRYLMSCPQMASAILQAGRVIRERSAPVTPLTGPGETGLMEG
jgi:hypothetical protein